MMNEASALWARFLSTGAPETYLQYRNCLAAEAADRSHSCISKRRESSSERC